MSQIIRPLDIDNLSRIVILTGAGISVASGLPTFRGVGGIYNGDVEWVSDGNNLPDSLAEVWRFYGGRRAQFSEAKPNAGHIAIAELQRRRGPEAVTVVTQNVDGLHQRAGCIDVIELHGSLSKTRCTNVDCKSAPFDDWSVYDTPPPALSARLRFVPPSRSSTKCSLPKPTGSPNDPSVTSTSSSPSVPRAWSGPPPTSSAAPSTSAHARCTSTKKKRRRTPFTMSSSAPPKIYCPSYSASRSERRFFVPEGQSSMLATEFIPWTRSPVPYDNRPTISPIATASWVLSTIFLT